MHLGLAGRVECRAYRLSGAVSEDQGIFVPSGLLPSIIKNEKMDAQFLWLCPRYEQEAIKPIGALGGSISSTDASIGEGRVRFILPIDAEHMQSTRR